MVAHRDDSTLPGAVTEEAMESSGRTEKQDVELSWESRKTSRGG